ncbi:MAG: ABC transporter ATP-binding protein [Eubacteriales bacterium]|nr:ABC transporter ATP-binding protein [Eubacteriales bacterium]
MIKFNNIEIKFGDFVAIKDLSLEVKEGEFFTFLGPSGCGKTTTLRALAGFVKPTKGSIEVAGEDITYKPIEKRGIGMVFQSYALFPTMTVEENITFGLKENKWDKAAIAAQLKRVAEMVNLTDEQLKKNVSALSGGQQQRVAIARALALNPKIIVLDEPLSNLDAKLRKSLRLELKKIQKSSGTTMIYVTHDQEEALTLSDRIAVFNNGCIEQIGTPREIYYSPRSEFVTNFIGDTNQLSNEVVEKINKYNSEAKLNPQDHIYVRVENVKEEGQISEKEKYFVLPAYFQTEEFYGITTRKTFNIGNSEIKSMSLKNDKKLEVGAKMDLFINPSDFIVFKEL